MKPTPCSNENRRWLLVDDNAGVLMALSAMAENLTTATIECHGSAESALAAFTAAPDRYELVITDFEMPGMDGVELCRRLLAILPAQKIVVATGSGLLSEAAARHHGFSALLKKPFPLEALQGALATAGLENECGRTI